MNIFSIDVEDWFHILDLPSTPEVSRWDGLESRVERNFLSLLDELDASKTKATCFFLGWVAERFPALVKEASARGHELASHGYAHQLIYTQTREAFRADVRSAKAVIEDISGAPVLGYRAPGFSVREDCLWALEELARAGYRYDTSVFPARRGHGGLPGANRRPHQLETPAGPLYEFPISVADLFGATTCFFGGGYFRLFPYPLIRRMARRVESEGRPIVYYLHPREIDPEQPRLPMGPLRRFKSYVNLSSTRSKLRSLTADGPLTSFAEWCRLNRVKLV